MMLRQGSKRDGFTLIEVLVALAIFVGAAAALSRLLVLGVENAEFANWQTEALLVAENHFAELDAGIITIDDIGTFPDPDYTDWQWTMLVESTDVEGLFRITMMVENISGGPGNGFILELVRMYFDRETFVETTSTS